MIAQVLLVALSLGSYSAAICTQSYTVKSGDGCNTIAAANGISSYQVQSSQQSNSYDALTVLPDPTPQRRQRVHAPNGGAEHLPQGLDLRLPANLHRPVRRYVRLFLFAC